MDARPALGGLFFEFGVSGLVTPRGESEVLAVTVVVHPPEGERRADEARPAYDRLETGEELKTASFAKVEIQGLPVGSLLVVTEGADVGSYTTDRMVYEDAEIFTVRLAQVAGS